MARYGSMLGQPDRHFQSQRSRCPENNNRKNLTGNVHYHLGGSVFPVSGNFRSALSTPIFNYKNRQKERNNISRKCTLINISTTWKQAAHCTYLPSSPSHSTKAIQKCLSLNKRYCRIFCLKKSEEQAISSKIIK